MVKIIRIQYLFLVCTLFFVTAYSPKAQAIDPRTKAVLTMAAYGTAGGALLGTASLAFGTKGRAVPIGASLGLYAGLIFGTYIVVNHRMEHQRRYSPDSDYYPDSEGFSPYEGDAGGGWGDWFGGGGAYWSEPIQGLDLESDHTSLTKINNWAGKSPDTAPPVYINLFKYQF